MSDYESDEVDCGEGDVWRLEQDIADQAYEIDMLRDEITDRANVEADLRAQLAEAQAGLLAAAERVSSAVAAFAEEQPDASAFQVAVVAQTVASSYRPLTVDDVATGIVLEEWLRLRGKPDA